MHDVGRKSTRGVRAEYARRSRGTARTRADSRVLFFTEYARGTVTTKLRTRARAYSNQPPRGLARTTFRSWPFSKRGHARTHVTRAWPVSESREMRNLVRASTRGGRFEHSDATQTQHD